MYIYFKKELLLLGLLIVSCNCKRETDDIYNKPNGIKRSITKSGCDMVPGSEDYRAYQHGINFVRKNDTLYYLIWGSSGVIPLGPGENGSWTHDVYYSEINVNNPIVIATLLISADEAQEPPSADISADGHIFITMEDGYNVKNVVGQRYAVYDNEMNPIKDYPNMIYDGGHSGHVATVGNKFVVFWSNDWDSSVPGADGIGTGLDVLADVFSSVGDHIARVEIATDDNRDWWPIIAGSDKQACMIWQRYVQGDKYAKLMYSVYDVDLGELLVNSIELESNLKYYTYDVQYYEEIDRFLIIGSYYTGEGFALLLEPGGEIVDKVIDIPAIVREAQGVAFGYAEKVKLVYARMTGGIIQFTLNRNKIVYEQSIADDYNWFGVGTDGVFLNDSTVFMIDLSPCGLVERRFIVKG